MLGNMRKLDAEEVKKIQIEILDYVDDFCKKNDINYWLDCGNLLGAIRHKGFIPWDDDIDIGMLRPDYEKFLEVFNDSNSKYKVSSVELDEQFLFPYGKIMDTSTVLYEPDEMGIRSCVNLDLFVYDNAPDDDKLVKKMYKKRDFYNRCRFVQSYRAGSKANFKRKILRFFIRCGKLVLKLFPENFFVKRIAINSKKYSSIETARVGDFTSISRIASSKEIFNSFVNVEFEGKMYKAPVGYDEWLTNMYGDYMKLPPIEKQVNHHKFVAFKND